MDLNLSFFRRRGARANTAAMPAATPAYLAHTADQIDRADKLTTSASEVPALLLQLSLQAGLAVDRRLEFASYMASGAVDENTNAETALSWYLALRALLDSFSAVPAEAAEAVQALRWRAFEMAIRAGLSVEAEETAAAAMAVGPMPRAQIEKIATWTHTAETVETVLHLLPQWAAPDAVRQVTALLETQRTEFAHDRS